MKTPDEIKKYAQTWREVLVDDCVDFPYAVHTMLHTAAGLVESLLTEIEQVKRVRDAAVKDIEDAAPCFACIRFERNGGDCIGAHVCADAILQEALGGKYVDYYFEWRGVQEVE